MPEEKLQIIQDAPTRYHFKTKDDQRVDTEHKDEIILLGLYKWGEETSLEIALDTVPTPNHTFSENKIEIENPDFLLRVYPIDTRSTGELYGDSDDDIQCHDGGLRFELVLKKKRPAMSNSFLFPLVAKNLRFSYQPFLTEQDIADGNVRPLNAEGSYAVYHASKKNNQYMTGKAFHIYRPIAEDALGNKAWCSLHIDGYTNPSNLTITVPQQFLDEVTYPVTIDPDFGYTAIGASSLFLANGAVRYRRGSAWTMPAGGPFIANYIRARVGGIAQTADDVKAFINQKDSGGANTHGQIAVKENLACAQAEHWEEFTLSGEGLTSGIDYILNAIGNTLVGKENYRIKHDLDGAVASYSETAAPYVPPDDPWVDAPDGTTDDKSIYCNYSEPEVGLENKSANMGSKMVAAGLI